MLFDGLSKKQVMEEKVVKKDKWGEQQFEHDRKGGSR